MDLLTSRLLVCILWLGLVFHQVVLYAHCTQLPRKVYSFVN